MSGQVIMQGFLHFHIPVWMRRAVTMLPSLVVIAAGLDPTAHPGDQSGGAELWVAFRGNSLVMFTRNPRLWGCS